MPISPLLIGCEQCLKFFIIYYLQKPRKMTTVPSYTKIQTIVLSLGFLWKKCKIYTHNGEIIRQSASMFSRFIVLRFIEPTSITSDVPASSLNICLTTIVLVIAGPNNCYCR